MFRYCLSLLVLTLLSLFTAIPVLVKQDGQTTITVSVEDDYTNAPIVLVLVRLLDGGSDNNIFQDRAGDSDIGMEINSEFQVDSDCNLFHCVNSAYVGGSTTTGDNDIIDDPFFTNNLL